VFGVINRGKYPVLGVQISAIDYEYAVDAIVRAAKSRSPLAVSALAVHGVMTGFYDPVHRRRLNGLDLVTPDGQPVRWALNWIHGVKLPDRVYGPTMTLKVLTAAASEGVPVYFYGSKQETLDQLLDNLKQKFPNLKVVGAEPSKFRRLNPEEKQEVIQRIKDSGAAIAFVGLGCPRQEVWAYEYRDELSMPLLAVGAAFDFHAGVLPQAPSWMQNLGLEWLFRLIQEPGRLWKRYLFLNPVYLTFVFLEMLSVSKRAVLMPDGKEPEESYG
jgi:exopolysaccharide biosynthesis WecB/TagA/CpsF family protein